MDQHHRTEIDDDDTGDSLDGLILSVVDSLGDDGQGQRHGGRPTSAPPVEGSSLSQNIFLNERGGGGGGGRNDHHHMHDFLGKSSGGGGNGMLGGGPGVRGGKRGGNNSNNMQQHVQTQSGMNGSSNVLGLEDVLSSMSLSSPTSPQPQSASRFDFLDLTRSASAHQYQGGMHTALPPPPNSQAAHDSSAHQRSLSQGSYGYPLGPQLLNQVVHGTPHSSPPLPEAGGDGHDADVRGGGEAEIQQQIEELQRRLQWQRQMAHMKQQHHPAMQQQRGGGMDWSGQQPRMQQQQPQQPMYAQQQQQAYGGMNGAGRYDPQQQQQFEGDYRYAMHGMPGMQQQQQQPQQQQGMHGGGGMKGMHAQQQHYGGKGPRSVQPQQQPPSMGSQYMSQPPAPSAPVSSVTPFAPTTAAAAGAAGAFQDKLPADAPLEQLEGRFLQLAQEQNGCRYLQQRIAREGPTGAALVLREVFPHLVQLMMDPFANYMYQKLLEHAAPEQRLRMLETVRGSLLVASLNLHGTRSVQKHIEMGGKDARQRDIIAAELAPFVTKLSMDTNGNHVVQRMLQHLDRCEFVCDAIIRDLLIVTRHRHGCCVVQRSLDAADPAHRLALINRIEENALQLMQDPFANYTVQYVIEHGTHAEGLRIIELVRGKIETLSKQKFSSNVVERCLIAAPPPLLQQFVDEAIMCMGELLHDAFANFVAQKMLDPITNDAQARALVAAMRPHLLDLNPSCSRRVANRIVKRFPDTMADDVIQRVLGAGTAAVPGVPVPGGPMMAGVAIPMAAVNMQAMPPPPPPHLAAMFRPMMSGHPQQQPIPVSGARGHAPGQLM